MDKHIIQQLLATLRDYDKAQASETGEIISNVAESVRNSYDNAQDENDAVFLKELSVISRIAKTIDYQRIESEQQSKIQVILEELLKYAVNRFGQNSRPATFLNELIKNFKN